MTTSYAAEVLADSPFLYYACDETAGAVVHDKTGNGNNGALFGSYVLNDSPQSAAAPGAIKFSAGGIRVDAAGVNPTGDYTIEIASKFASTNIGLLFGVFESTAPYAGPSLFCNYLNTDSNAPTNGALCLRDTFSTVSGTTVAYNNPSLPLNDGHYRIIHAIRRGLNQELWINGILVATNALPGIYNVQSQQPLWIMGRGDYSDQDTLGSLDETSFYLSALSPSRIALHSALYLGYKKISGQAKLSNGAAASRVVVYGLDSRSIYSDISPAADGSFLAYAPSGNYLVTALGPAGYQPLSHGPVTPVDI